MNEKLRSMKLLSKILLISFLCVSFQQAAFAGMVSTPELVDKQFVQDEKQRMLQLLSTEEVQSQLIALGVDADDAKQRLENMSGAEVVAFANKMDEMPAGSGIVGAAVLVFLVLLVTDLLGYTDVFPFVKKTIN